MPNQQLARGLWAQFANNEAPFNVPNGMEENLRVVDDHLGLYTLAVPQAPGTPLPESPADGDGQIYLDGSYAVYNGGAWKRYAYRPGMKAVMADASDMWLSTPTGGWLSLRQTATLDSALVAGHVYPSTAAGVAAVAPGEYFTVPSAQTDEFVILYQRVGAAAVEIKQYPSRSALAEAVTLARDWASKDTGEVAPGEFSAKAWARGTGLIDGVHKSAKGYMEDAQAFAGDAGDSAAAAFGYLQAYRATSYGALASDPATDPLGNPPTEGDEYFNLTAKLIRRFNGVAWQSSDLNTAVLAQPSGALSVGYDDGTVQDVLDNAKAMQSYTALRNYSGRATGVRITSPGIAGFFQRLGTAGLVDNNGTIIIDALGRAWQRLHGPVIDPRWFGAKLDWNGTTGTDDTAALQAALDYAWSLRGIQTVRLSAAAKTSATLIQGSSVVLTGGGIICAADNIPVVRVSKETLNTFWAVKHIGLSHVNPQAYSGGGDGLSLAGDGTASYMYDVTDVIATNCANTVSFTSGGGAAVFMGNHENIFAYDCSGITIKINAPTIGAHTTLSFNHIYHQGVLGAEKTTAAVMDVHDVVGLTLDNIACDRTANPEFVARFTACRGTIGSIVAEGNIATKTAGTAGLFVFSGSNMRAGTLVSTYNTVNLSGSAGYGLIRLDTSAVLYSDLIFDNNASINDTSSDNYYTVAIDSTSVIYNEQFQRSGSSPVLSVSDFGVNSKAYARRIGGDDRTLVQGGKFVVFGTAAPTSGTWAVGDKLRNTSPSLTVNPVTEWTCVAAGTPGTWAPSASLTGKGATSARPTSPGLGTMYLDTTLAAKGKPIWSSETPVKAVVTFVVTGPAVSSGNLIITLDGGSPLYIPVTAGDTAGTIAAYVRNLYVAGYTIGGSGTTNTFTKNISKAVSAPAFSENGTGVTATITLTTQGVSGWVDATGAEV